MDAVRQGNKGWHAACGLLLAVLSPTDDPAVVSPPEPAGAPAGLITRGQQLLSQYQCGGCHLIPGVSAAAGQLGPALVGFGRRSYIAGELPHTPALLQRWIVDPQSLLPGTAMPAMGASAADAQAMAAYLATLR